MPLSKLLELLGDAGAETAVTAAVDDLRERALVWGDAAVRVTTEAAYGLPWYPGQATVEDTEPKDLAERLSGLDEAQSDLLQKLLEGSPVGRTRDAAAGTPPDRPVQRLLAAGLLRQVDADTVILPRLVGQALRGELPGPVGLIAPDPVVSTTTTTDVDAVAAGAAIDLLREVEVVLETRKCCTCSRAPQRRPRGARRQTADEGHRYREHRLGLILEVTAAAGLIATGMPEPEPPDGTGPYWAPTVATDRYLESPAAQKWLLLAVDVVGAAGQAKPGRKSGSRR